MRQAAGPDIQMMAYPLRPGGSSSSVKEEIIKNENSAEESNVKSTHIIRRDQMLPVSAHVWAGTHNTRQRTFREHITRNGDRSIAAPLQHEIEEESERDDGNAAN